VRTSATRSGADRSGFVLIEAVAALAIIGLASIALLITTSTQLQTAGKASELLVQKSLAEDRLAAIRLLDYEDLASVPDSLTDGTFAEPFTQYSWIAAIEEIEDEYDLFGVEITVVGPLEVYPLRTLLHRPRRVVTTTAGDAGDGAQGGRGAGGDGGEGARRGGDDAGRGGRGGDAGGRGGTGTGAGRGGGGGDGSGPGTGRGGGGAGGGPGGGGVGGGG